MSKSYECVDCSRIKDNVADVYLTEIGAICERCYEKRIRGFFKALNGIIEDTPDYVMRESLLESLLEENE